jgi:hypothetical protein
MTWGEGYCVVPAVWDMTACEIYFKRGPSMSLLRFATTSLAAITCLATVACGGGGDDGGDDTVTGDHYKYVASGVDVPTSNAESTMYGMDIDGHVMDGDPGVDNQLGNVLVALAGFNFDIQANIDESVNGGDIILLADFQTSDFTNAGRSALRIYLGDMPTPAACTDPTMPATCGQHLMGGASFTLDPASPTDAMVAGPVVNGVFTGGPGTITLQIALSAGAPIDLNLIGAKAEIRGASATNIMMGKLAGAIPDTEIQNNILPAVQAQLADIIMTDCTDLMNPPTCGCTGSASMIIDLFDTNMDCSVSVMEIQTNNLIMSLLAPDVRLCPDGGSSCDIVSEGIDALSLGIGFSAVSAVFTAPGT